MEQKLATRNVLYVWSPELKRQVQFVVTYFAGLVFMNLFEIVVSVLFVVNLWDQPKSFAWWIIPKPKNSLKIPMDGILTY